MVWEPDPTLSETTILANKLPVAAGMKLTSSVQLAPGAKEPPTFRHEVTGAGETNWKEAELVPEIAIPLITTGVLPELKSVDV